MNMKVKKAVRSSSIVGKPCRIRGMDPNDRASLVMPEEYDRAEGMYICTSPVWGSMRLLRSDIEVIEKD